jgi:hypothetical protein
MFNEMQQLFEGVWSWLLMIFHMPNAFAGIAHNYLAYGPPTNSTVALIVAVTMTVMWSPHFNKVTAIIRNIPMVGGITVLFAWYALFSGIFGFVAASYVAAAALMTITMAITARQNFSAIFAVASRFRQ